jgi:CRISPR-associated protein Cas5h
MLAAVLGWERDTYYDALSTQKAKIAVRIMKPSRSVMQTVNYIDTDQEGLKKHLDGSRARTLIPLEIVLPIDFDDLLSYRVFLLHADSGVTRELFSLLNTCRTKFPLYFGLTEFPAWVQRARLYEGEDFELREEKGGEVAIDTVLPVGKVEEITGLDSGVRIHKDRIPLDFTGERTLSHAASVIWEAKAAPIRAKIRGEVFKTSEESGVFLE